MAYLEPTPNGGCPSRNYSVVFSFGGRIWKKSTDSKDRIFADACLARVRENLRLAGIGRLAVPVGVDVAAFMMSDGKLQGEPRVAESPTITELIRQYKASLPTDSLESETIRILTIHMRHFERILGTRFRINRLTQQNLQRYVNERSQQQGIRGKKVRTATIKKELDTFRTIWVSSTGRTVACVHGETTRSNAYVSSKVLVCLPTEQTLPSRCTSLTAGESLAF